MGDDYIIGDVTIVLARLIDHAKSRQIMISDFGRSNGNGRDVGTEEFLELSCQIFNDLQIIKIGNSTIAGVSRYLPGPQNEDGSYSIQNAKSSTSTVSSTMRITPSSIFP